MNNTLERSDFVPSNVDQDGITIFGVCILDRPPTHAEIAIMSIIAVGGLGVFLATVS